MGRRSGKRRQAARDGAGPRPAVEDRKRDGRVQLEEYLDRVGETQGQLRGKECHGRRREKGRSDGATESEHRTVGLPEGGRSRKGNTTCGTQAAWRRPQEERPCSCR